MKQRLFAASVAMLLISTAALNAHQSTAFRYRGSSKFGIYLAEAASLNNAKSSQCPAIHDVSKDLEIPGVATDIAQLVEQAQGGDTTALSRLQKFANSGDMLAQYKLGKLYYFGCHNGRGVPQDGTQAIHWLSMAADQGHGISASLLSQMYSQGIGVPKDADRALHWSQRSAFLDKGNSIYVDGKRIYPSLVNGRVTLSQEGIKAIEWTRAMAAKGSATSQADLGELYRRGREIPSDSNQEAQWFLRAATQGNAVAQRNLGILYMTGRGVPKDTVQTLRWLEAAAKQGDGMAAYKLGDVYLSGLGVPKDAQQAGHWYSVSAEDGFNPGQLMLAILYGEGRGVPQDDTKAIEWFLIDLACVDNQVMTDELFERIEARITPEQLRVAQQAASKWWQANAPHETSWNQ